MRSAAFPAMAADAVPSLGLPPPQPLGGTATERALEEAAATGTLSLAGRRLRCFPDRAAQRWDLSDTTQAGEDTPPSLATPPPLGHAPHLAAPPRWGAYGGLWGGLGGNGGLGGGSETR